MLLKRGLCVISVVCFSEPWIVGKTGAYSKIHPRGFAQEANVKMNRILAVCCVIAVALLAGVAAQAQTFQGFYIGGNGGSVHGSSDAFTGTVFSPTGYFSPLSIPDIATAATQKPSSNGFSGGGQAGYNYQSGHFVLGFEVDFGAMHLNSSKTTTAIYSCCPPPNNTFTITQTVTTGWLFTARPRLGLAFGHWLVYGTAGAAVASRNYQAVFTDTFAAAHENGGVDNNATGLVWGGGVEVKVGGSGHWSVKGEYLHAGFNAATTVSTNLMTTPIEFTIPNPFTHSADLTAGIARGGVNFRF